MPIPERNLLKVWAVFNFVLILTGTGSALAQRPLGIDVSHYQGTIDWGSVKGSGVSFALAKATEGTTYTDPTFTLNAANARNAGVYFGAYHFARPDANLGLAGADNEAAFCWSVIKDYVQGGGAYLMPVLDYETAPGASYNITTSSQWVNRWCQDMVNYGTSNGVVVKPVVYTYTSFATAWLDSTVTQWPLWMAQYPSSPNPQTGAPPTSPWSGWNVWQYSSTGTVPGISGACDLDVFNGTASTLASTLVIGGNGAATINTQPASVTVAQGANALLMVASTNATTYQWTFNAANISGATASSLTISNAQPSSVGAYAVAVSNSIGGTLSSAAYLTVLSNAPGAGVSPSGMVNWWPADGTPVDIYGGLIGTPRGGFSYAAGETGQGFHFDGSTAVVNLTATNIPVPWTACMWVYRQNTPQTSAALLADNTYSLKLEQYSNTFNVGFTQLGVADYVFSPAYSVPVNTWTHLAFVGTSSGVSLYANGVLKASLPNSIPLPRTYIGAAYVTSPGKYIDFMLGTLDEIMLFNRALSVPEIGSIYNAGGAGLVKVPQFTSATPSAPGQVTFGLQGLTGKNFSLYSSPDLIHWSFFGTIGNPTGATQFIDNNVSNNVQIFYRASQPY